MKLFGKKVPEPTDEDLAAIARLNAFTSRLKPPSTDLTEVAPDPFGDPAEEPEEPAQSPESTSEE